MAVDRKRAKEIAAEFRADVEASGYDTAVAHIAVALAMAEAGIPLDEGAAPRDCGNARHDEIEAWYRQAVALSERAAPLDSKDFRAPSVSEGAAPRAERLAFEGFTGHKPQPDGRCEHRWRNRQTKIVTCSFADGWAARVLAEAAGQDPLENVLADLRAEVAKARTKHPPINSPHEGWAVIREELDPELWEHVCGNTGRTVAARQEALQIAAMGVQYILDLIDDPPRRRPSDERIPESEAVEACGWCGWDETSSDVHAEDCGR